MHGTVRSVLLWVVPLFVIIAAVWFYLAFRHIVSTDNAYVKSEKSGLSPYVSGHVTRVHILENEHVEPGQLLLEIDDKETVLAVARAEADLEAARTEVQALKATFSKQAAQVEVAREQARLALRELERKRDLAARNLASASDVDEAQKEYEMMHGMAAVMRASMAETAARLAGDSDIDVDLHPDVKAAMARLEDARLMQDRTLLKAPRAGIASQVPYVGDYLQAGTPALAIVSDQAPWIEANFKETELTDVRIGQPVDIDIDTYPGHHWQGRVESIAQATGAEFALLPPQNSTGNWVKVVQRIPVRIAIDPDKNAPQLRAGMSAVVRIDTGDTLPTSAPR